MTSDKSLISPTPASRLYSVGQITFATWAASPLAGCLLLGLNYRALGKSMAVFRSILSSLILSSVLFGIAYVYDIPRMLLPIASAAAIWPLAWSLQGNAIKNHLAAGGRKGSWWNTVVFNVGVVLSMIAVLIAGIVIYHYLPSYYECFSCL